MRLAFSWSTFGFHLVCDWSTLGRHVVDAWTTLGLNSVCACPPFVYTPQSTLIRNTQTHVASRLSVVRGSAERCELLLCEFVSFKSSMAGDILIMLMLVVSMGDWVGDADDDHDAIVEYDVDDVVDRDYVEPLPTRCGLVAH